MFLTRENLVEFKILLEALLFKLLILVFLQRGEKNKKNITKKKY